MEQQQTQSYLGQLGELSDGVFCLLISLLVFDFRFPDVAPDYLIRRLLEQADQLGAYILTLVLLAGCWAVHQRIFCRVVRFDRKLVQLNSSVLVSVALLPLWTALAHDSLPLPISISLLVVAVCFAAASLISLWRHSFSVGSRSEEHGT